MIKKSGKLMTILSFRTMLCVGCMLVSIQPLAFTGQVPGLGDSPGCADYINAPERYYRLPSGQVTFRITQNFKDRYPDEFSQYLVADSARLLSDFLSTHKYSWIDDIQDRKHYLKQNYSHSYYGLKGILLHEFGHAMGMQHVDGCFYNTNEETGDPWDSNFHLIGGGNVAITEPSGLEMMAGNPVADFITPDEDVFDFFSYAYPFQTINFIPTSGNNQVIRVDSTDADELGGQTEITDKEKINPDDDNQGWNITGANIWVGNDNFILYDYNTWYVENTSGHDINQVTMRINGTSTRKPFVEESPDVFTHLGINTTSSPEQLIYGWSTPVGQSWPAPNGVIGIPGGNPNTEPPRFSLELDAYGTVVQETLLWSNSNEAFDVAFPTVHSFNPWVFSPNTPPIETAPPYALASLPLSEPGSIVNNIELQFLPVNPNPVNTRRGFKLIVPQIEGVVFENIDVLKLNWREAEILMHLHNKQRASSLSKQFVENNDDVQKLLRPNGHHTYNSIGFNKDESMFIQDNNAQFDQRVPMAKQFQVDIRDDKTYATRVVLSSPAGRVYHYTLPEMNRYMGSRKARCEISGDPESCCPYEMQEPILVETNWSSEHLVESSCIVGSKANDYIVLNGRKPHLLASGSGDDKVIVKHSESTVQLGQGDDYFETQQGVAAHVNGGSGKDTLLGSSQNDYMSGGEGNDFIKAGKGNDILAGGKGNDYIQAGPGNDIIYPGSGFNDVEANQGDDQVIYSHSCELKHGSKLMGGEGKDTLVLPMKYSTAKELGLEIDGFEEIIENVTRESVISPCEP